MLNFDVLQDRKSSEYSKTSARSIGLSCLAQPFNSGLCTIDDVIEVLTNCGGKRPTSSLCPVTMGVNHGRTGGTSPPEFGAGGIVPQILSCCQILSPRFLALQCRKMCFCLYSRTFIVSPAMRVPPEFQSDLCLCL